MKTSPSFAIASSNARCLAWFRAFSTFLAFLPERGARGPLVGCRTLLGAVPRGFLEILFVALRFWTLVLLAFLLWLLGTFGFPREGILGGFACGFAAKWLLEDYRVKFGLIFDKYNFLGGGVRNAGTEELIFRAGFLVRYDIRQ